MRYLKNTLIVALLASAHLLAAQSLQQKIDMNIDGLGNAAISISMTLPAQQWQAWNQNFGNNPAALKRDIERSMPAYFLEDFKLEKNDMDRSFTVSLKAPGICQVDKKGRWFLTTDEKDAQLTKLTDHKYMMVQSPQEFGGGMQQTTMVTFPETASDIELDKDPLGKTVFRFEMNEPASALGYMLWVGLALMAAGIGWLLFVLFR
ncbi:MAG: hypothetical protein JNL52_11755 [Flavobacteriales bacterium]|nr:hypothetical protein [Flavobacteriales bacterium]